MRLWVIMRSALDGASRGVQDAPMENTEYFWLLTFQWNSSGKTVAQAFKGKVLARPHSTEESLTLEVLEYAKKLAGIEEDGLPVVLFFSLKPNRLP